MGQAQRTHRFVPTSDELVGPLRLTHPTKMGDELMVHDLFRRRLLLGVLAMLVFTLAACSTTDAIDQKAQVQISDDDQPPTHWLNNPLGMVDGTVQFHDAASWASGEVKDAQVSVSEATGRYGIVIDQPEPTNFPRLGQWTSPTIETEFPVLQILPSWNLETPEGTGAAFFVRTRDAEDGAWSPWLYLGSWGRSLRRGKDVIQFDRGEVAIDYIILDQPTDAFEIRADLYSFHVDTVTTPHLRKLTAVYSGKENQQTRPNDHQPSLANAGGGGVGGVDLGVVFRSQGWEPRMISHEVCSPTSVSMAMHFAGVDLPVQACAVGIYDDEYDLFGNWGRAVAWAGQHGLHAELVRIRRWEQLEDYLRSGQPVIASIRFREGEFPSNVMKSTFGHLILIRGLTDEGHAIVNDSASKDRGEGVVYINHELARAWIAKGGVAYIIRPLDG